MNLFVTTYQQEEITLTLVALFFVEAAPLEGDAFGALDADFVAALVARPLEVDLALGSDFF